MGQDGVEIFTNSSASHHELRKADIRVNLIKSATTKVSFEQVSKKGLNPLKIYFLHDLYNIRLVQPVGVSRIFTGWDMYMFLGVNANYCD